jgi:hypothetical protein
MKYLNQPKVSSKTVLSNFDPNVMSYSGKVTVTNLPESVIPTDSSGLIDSSESTFTDCDLFIDELQKRLERVISHGQKNRLYKITLLLGNFDESEIPLLENAPFIVTETPLLSTEKLIAGGVIRVTAGLT